MTARNLFKKGGSSNENPPLKLLAIVDAFKYWRHYLEFSPEPATVINDHKNLEYSTTTRNLTCRQVR
ncbi:hypothetical protein [Parasitella parasitica]|uniref:Reverse transcriptase RNase H-like domain-containing protein n=1 Tax=Parasitella parasitica TaxID=35722 RepID=A0A0B7MXM6_9FUNG|nr:hypothetical protein [Parasitella parasitica]